MATLTTKRAFTLVELLVVVGILAAMATLSIGSYFGVVRGMADRGAVAAATSILTLAEARANLDLTPTMVFFYNELVQREDDSDGTDLVAAGFAIAVRRAGRISGKDGSLLLDEFADLNLTYDLAKTGASRKSKDSFRLYRMDYSSQKMDYSTVYSTVVEREIDINYSASLNEPNSMYCVEKPIDKQRFKKQIDRTKYEDVNVLLSYAFEETKGGESATWKVGDAYGYEFARIQLPNNYIFGSVAPKSSDSAQKPKVVKVIVCWPDKGGDDSSVEDSVDIYTTSPRGDFSRKAGSTKREMKDV